MWLLLVFAIACDATRNVVIQNGTVVGFSIPAGSAAAWQFLGIPFAEKPIGPLRFAKPVPVRTRWSEPLIANKAPNRCPQTYTPLLLDNKVNESLVSPFDEDCLYLNIWTPKNVSSPKAVMVWLYGGGYLVGEGLPMYHGGALAALYDVLLVTPHYRIGALGFLRLGNEVGGNWGLWDQQAALHWVQANIAAFGGDPRRVTIFGESAGASSVNLHLLNQESAALFQRAIVQSGTAFGTWALSLRPSAIAEEHARFAAALKCSGTDTVQCLRTRAVKDILAEQIHYRWVPVMDEEFLMDDPKSLHPAKKAVMTGVTKDEGAFMSETVGLWADHFLNVSESHRDEVIADLLLSHLPYYPDKTSASVKTVIASLIKSYVNPKDRTLNRIRLNKVVGDALFVCPMNQLADQLQERGAPPYIFLFNHRSSFSPYASFVGATHGDELPYIFRWDVIYPHIVPMTTEEKELASRMAKDITNFAKTGRPASHGWQPSSAVHKEFFEFAIPGGPRTGGVHRDDCGFWTEAVPRLQASAENCTESV